MKLRENLKLIVVIVDTSVTPPLHYHHRLHLLQVTYDWSKLISSNSFPYWDSTSKLASIMKKGSVEEAARNGVVELV